MTKHKCRCGWIATNGTQEDIWDDIPQMIDNHECENTNGHPIRQDQGDRSSQINHQGEEMTTENTNRIPLRFYILLDQYTQKYAVIDENSSTVASWEPDQESALTKADKLNRQHMNNNIMHPIWCAGEGCVTNTYGSVWHTSLENMRHFEANGESQLISAVSTIEQCVPPDEEVGPAGMVIRITNDEAIGEFDAFLNSETIRGLAAWLIEQADDLDRTVGKDGLA